MTTATETRVFDRVVAGVDGSDAGFDACRQAARVVESGGLLEVFTAVHLADAALTGWLAPRIADELEHDAREASRRALEIAGPQARPVLVNAPPVPSLMRELERTQATLVVVGSHGHPRWSEILSGGVMGELLHCAACSVLVARPAPDEAVFPARIVVGYDGAPRGEAARAAAESLASRFGASLSMVTALGGKPVDLNAASAGVSALQLRYEDPARALMRASRDADLLVVGSRGLHGFKALGSVSERVAHEASCSVLVVRAGSG